MTKTSLRLVSHLFSFVALMLLAVLAAQSRSGARSGDSVTEPGNGPGVPTARDLTVHEWGTFTAIAGRDGKPMARRPLVWPSDLPAFDYKPADAQDAKGLRHGYQCFKCQEAIVRMETPVLYFY